MLKEFVRYDSLYQKKSLSSKIENKTGEGIEKLFNEWGQKILDILNKLFPRKDGDDLKIYQSPKVCKAFSLGIIMTHFGSDKEVPINLDFILAGAIYNNSLPFRGQRSQTQSNYLDKKLEKGSLTFTFAKGKKVITK